jgi:hypothetical protein
VVEMPSKTDTRKEYKDIAEGRKKRQAILDEEERR